MFSQQAIRSLSDEAQNLGSPSGRLAQCFLCHIYASAKFMEGLCFLLFYLCACVIVNSNGQNSYTFINVYKQLQTYSLSTWSILAKLMLKPTIKKRIFLVNTILEILTQNLYLSNEYRLWRKKNRYKIDNQFSP